MGVRTGTGRVTLWPLVGGDGGGATAHTGSEAAGGQLSVTRMASWRRWMAALVMGGHWLRRPREARAAFQAGRKGWVDRELSWGQSGALRGAVAVTPDIT